MNVEADRVEFYVFVLRGAGYDAVCVGCTSERFAAYEGLRNCSGIPAAGDRILNSGNSQGFIVVVPLVVRAVHAGARGDCGKDWGSRSVGRLNDRAQLELCCHGRRCHLEKSLYMSQFLS